MDKKITRINCLTGGQAAMIPLDYPDREILDVAFPTIGLTEPRTAEWIRNTLEGPKSNAPPPITATRELRPHHPQGAAADAVRRPRQPAGSLPLSFASPLPSCSLSLTDPEGHPSPPPYKRPIHPI
jgi:hypothetical protein